MNVHASLRTMRFAALVSLHRKLASDVHALERSRVSATVHHARVRARRMRVIIKALGAECRPSTAATLLFDLRDIGRALGPLREADVRLQYLESLLSKKNIAVTDATLLRARLRHDLRDRKTALQRQIQTRGWVLRLRRIAKCLASDELLALPSSAAARPPEITAMTHNIRRIRHMLRGKLRDVTEIHALRIRIKRARYLHDFMVELHLASSATFNRHLEKWQTALGLMHDHLQVDAWLKDLDIHTSLKKRLRAALKESIQQDVRSLNRLRKRLAERFPSS